MPGQLALLAELPGLLRAHAHARLGGADDDGRVGHLQGLDDFAAESRSSRGVQHIDLTAVVFDGATAVEMEIWRLVSSGS